METLDSVGNKGRALSGTDGEIGPLAENGHFREPLEETALQEDERSFLATGKSGQKAHLRLVHIQCTHTVHVWLNF